jgi:hypothetical protein
MLRYVARASRRRTGRPQKKPRRRRCMLLIDIRRLLKEG